MTAEEKRELVEKVMDGFTSLEVHGGVIGKGGSANIVFEYTGNPELIEHIQPDCGCTTTDSQLPSDGLIKVAYKDNVTDSLSADDLKERYPAGVINISKGISVFIADGNPLKVVNERGVQVWNPAKLRIRLNFFVDIDCKNTNQIVYTKS